MNIEAGGSLSARTVRAGIWTVGARLLSRVVDFVALLVLARFLGPADFGLVAMAMTVVFIVEAILELPLTAALIRIPDITDRMYNTAFTLGLLRGLLVAALMAALSWPLSGFYSDGRLMPLICALAAAPAMRGMISPRMIVFEKALDFRRKGLLELVGKMVAAAAAILVAVTTGSYWAMAAGTICTPAVMMILSYVMAPMRPRLTLADWPLFSDMIGWNFLSQVVSALNWQIDRILLPRYIDVSSFGHFATANDVASLPYQAIVAPVGSPLMSAFVRAHGDGNLKGAYLKACAGIIMVMAPVLCFIGIMAGPVITILLGPKWTEAAPILAGIALVSMISLPSVPMTALAMMLDRTRSVALRGFIELLVRFPLTIAGVGLFGIAGAIAARAGAALAVMLSSLFLARSMAGIGIRAQIMVSMRPFMALVPAAAVLYYCATSFDFSEYIYIKVAVAGLGYGLTYAAALYLSWIAVGRPAGLDANAFRTVSDYVGSFQARLR